MSNYFTDFTEYTTGVKPPDWTERWNASGAFKAESGGLDKILKGLYSTNARRACSWDAVDGDVNRADSEILVKLRSKAMVGGVTYGGLVLRGSGGVGTETGYMCGFLGASSLYITRYNSGSSTALVTTSVGLSADVWYWIRFRVNGTSLKARLWIDGNSEGGTWQINTTDSAISAAGFAGAFCFDQGGDLEYDAIAIATNGDTATLSSPGATATTLSGPSSGTTGVPSSNFTAGANGTITGTVTVTPNDGGDGGTFAPTSVAISSGTPTATFTYTPASTGVKGIGATNDGGLSNPTSINYTSNAAASTHDPVLSQRMRMSGYNYYGARR